MSSYRTADERGRVIFYASLSGRIEDIEYTEDEYDGIDIYLTGKTGIRAAVELKNRTAHTSTEIDAMGGHILERKKYDDLMNAYRTNNYKPIYCMIYPDAILMWDMRKIDGESRTIIKNCTPNCQNGYKKGGKAKEVILLKNSEAIIKKKYEN